MKLLKVLRRIFGILSALFGLLGLAAYIYYFDKTAECPYCALPDGLSAEETRAWLDRMDYMEAVLRRMIPELFLWFVVFLIAFLIITVVDLLIRRANFLRGHEREEWHGFIIGAVAAWWKKHETRITILKCILGVLSVFGGLMVLILGLTGVGSLSVADIPTRILSLMLTCAFWLMPLWILLALLGVERKIIKEKQRLSSTGESL